MRDDRGIFPNWRETKDDPALGIAFDLKNWDWSEPFSHEPPPWSEHEKDL